MSTGAGRATAGEVAEHAILVVPMEDGVWEFHDKPWDVSDEDQCVDSYWLQNDETATEWSKWAIQWVQPSELIVFVDTHWPEFDAVSLAAKQLPR